MIELIHFTKRYAKKNAPAVHDLNMSCRPGTITGLLGLNGAGKTTVLKAVCARHFATSGAVIVNELNASDEAEKVRLATGFVSEQAMLPGEYTVLEYIRLRAALYGLSGCAADEALERTLDWCALGDVRHQKIRTLSKGYAERVNFAQALVHNPPVLVLDEPASGLDPAQIVQMRALIKRLLPERTILLSTHLMQEVDALCDTVYILHKGACVASGKPEHIVRETGAENIEKAFFALTSDGKSS
ncbi:MAG: ABC transporter ATP-binding protein [Treponema sp.]|nr:ABC transporter ATP-binding protein [Treponema sp.]